MNDLYHGDVDSQIRQQILLGVGGIKLLSELDITPSIYHINEGRPGFIIWKIAEQIMKADMCSFEEAWRKAKEKIVYTNHTLVAAGNLTYPSSAIEKWAVPFASDLGIDKSLLINDGLIDQQTFSITLFALNISKKHSAVSKVHGDYAQREWPNFEWVTITNGVHFLRWQDSDFRNKSISDSDLWNLHMTKKRELVETVIKRTGFGYNPENLVISWARRLAEYKQPKAIFQDIQKLKKILSNNEKPVQLLFAGNSHSADPNAKSIIEEIIQIFATELSGHAIFIPNYNISLANHLVSGSDVWLNTPKGNLEACGTSGMKAISNGVLNCTVLDGWTYEVNWDGIGWVLDPNNIAFSFYEKLEKEITPLYYSRNETGIPDNWIDRMRKSIEVANQFSSEKMFSKYKKLLYGI
jgi:starch phosphorylase